MGNKKNTPGSHACHGKYARIRVSKKAVVNSQPMNNGSRIINLDNLQHHLQVYYSYIITCQPCITQALSHEQAIVLAGEHRAGLASILTTRCTEEFLFPT